MNRRSFLRRTGALGAIGLAGCTSESTDNESDGGPGAADSPTPEPTDSPTPTPTPPPVDIVSQSITTLSSSCSSGDESASVERDEEEKTIIVTGTLETSNPCHEATLEDVTYDSDVDRVTVDVGAEQTKDVCVDCVGAVEYEATVEFTGALPESTAVEHSGDPVGEGDSDTPTLIDSSLSVTDVHSSSQETTADVEFDTDANAVAVTGTIQGNDGCKTAALGRVTYNESDDRLRVDVVTEDREDAGSCTEQLVYIDYEATVQFEGGVPESASVSHNGDGIVGAAHGSASATEPVDR